MNQTRRDFEIVVVDNSGQGLVRSQFHRDTFRVLENPSNAGYGGAINRAAVQSTAHYIIALNDDTTLAPDWLAQMTAALDSDCEAGMAAGCVLLDKEDLVDSAGMLLCGDGSSKQRGHQRPYAEFTHPEEILFPSGAAAVYRRSMFEELGGFDESFFLYCEDTDLGLRARWAGWKCLYVPAAVARHHYSGTAGRVSPLKAYYVERNRLFVLLKNFPASLVWRAPLVSAERYFWHAVSMFGSSSAAARFRESGNASWQLVFIVLRAHAALLKHGWRLGRARKSIRRAARITPREFAGLCHRHSISPRQVAAL
jgi:GT2 family glycosyltransferase